MKQLRILFAVVGAVALAGLLTASTTLAQDDNQEEPGEGLWYARYYNNRDLLGHPTVDRNEIGLDYNWGTGSPVAGVNADNFSVRWTNYLSVPSGQYRFTVSSDDGVRVFVENEWIIDEWHQQATTTYVGYKYIDAARTEVVVEYFEAQGNANIELTWERVDAVPPVDPGAGEETADIAPESGVPGTQVNVYAEGFAPYATVKIGVGRQYSEYDIESYDETSATGTLNTNVIIPSYADPFERWVVVVETMDNEEQAVSEVFYVTERDGEVNDCGATYTVEEGDTLIDIADECNTTIAALMDANPQITDAGVIPVNATLSLPSEIEETPTAVLAPDTGVAGQGIALSIDGFEPNALLRVGLRRADGDVYHWSRQLRTDTDGAIGVEVTIPVYAFVGENWVVDVENLRTGIETTSNLFVVTR